MEKELLNQRGLLLRDITNIGAGTNFEKYLTTYVAEVERIDNLILKIAATQAKEPA